MPGGLDGRLKREQLRGMRLQNMEQVLNMGRPTGAIQDLGMLQDLQRPEMMMEIQRMQSAPQAMAMLSKFADPTELAIDYLRKMGLQGNLRPLPQMSFGDPEEEARLAQLERDIEERRNRRMQQEGQ